MPEKKAKAPGSGRDVFVRGADGSLYILSKDNKPQKLEWEEAEIVEKILEDATKQVEERLKDVASSRGSSVNVDVPSLPELPS